MVFSTFPFLVCLPLIVLSYISFKLPKDFISDPANDTEAIELGLKPKPAVVQDVVSEPPVVQPVVPPVLKGQ